MQDLGFICCIIGISGIAGAIEHGIGLIQSAVLLTIGAFILYKTYRIERGEREMKRKLTAFFLTAAVLIGWTSLSSAQEKYPEEPVLIESTAYYYGEITKDGSKVRPGIAAAKEEWLGLTAILYEVDPDGTIGSVCGIYEIRDTGSDYRIRNGTCIDIYIPDKEACIEYGRQQVYMQLIRADG